MNPSPSKPLSFLRRAMPMLALAISAGIASAPAWAQSPVAGTSIGNQATATYNDGSSIPRSVQSNSVTTVVQQVIAVDLTDPRIISRSPGSPVAFPHTIQNNGNGTDSFTIGVTEDAGDNFDIGFAIYADANQDGVPDNTTSITATPSLKPGEKFNFVIVGQVPSGQAATNVSNVTVTATSVTTPSLANSDSNIDTVRVSNNATVAIRKSVSGPVAGVYTYTLRYTNNSNVDASAVTITDALNARLIYAAGSGRSNLTGATVLTDDPADAAQSGINYGVGGAAGAGGRTVTATIASVPRNTTGTISFSVTLNNSVPGTVPNSAGLSYDDDNDNDPGDRVTDRSNTVDVAVNQAPGVSFADDAKGLVTQGATVTFANVLTNTGNGTDSFDITFNAGNTFPAGTTFQLFQPDATGLDGAAALLDSNGNGIPDTGPLAPGATYNVIVKAKLPANFSDAGVLAGNPTPPRYNVTLTGTSNGPGRPSDPATDTVNSITAATVEITNRVINGDTFTGTPVNGRVGQGALTAAPVLTRTANPGTVATFPLSVQNNSANNDNYALSFTSTPALPAGFSVIFRDLNGQVITNTGNLAPGAFFDYVAEVTVPAGATAQDIALLFTITSGASGASDTIRDRLTVNPVRALTITPNNQGQVFPGSSVNYAHTITNNGNGTETNITVSLADSLAGFSSVLYADTNGNGVLDATEQAAGPLDSIASLAPGISTKVIVKVFGPSNQFTSGAVNTTTLTAAVTSGPTASATDTTTIVAGDVTLTKSQSVGGGAQTQGNATALPGQTISYQILVRNTGGAAVSNVIVSDNTPAFTTYTTTGGAASYSIDGGATVAATSAPVSGSAGTITWTIATLNPGSVATVTFNVVINP